MERVTRDKYFPKSRGPRTFYRWLVESYLIVAIMIFPQALVGELDTGYGPLAIKSFEGEASRGLGQRQHQIVSEISARVYRKDNYVRMRAVDPSSAEKFSQGETFAADATSPSLRVSEPFTLALEVIPKFTSLHDRYLPGESGGDLLASPMNIPSKKVSTQVSPNAPMSYINWFGDGPFYPASRVQFKLPSFLRLRNLQWSAPQVISYLNQLRAGYTGRFYILAEFEYIGREVERELQPVVAKLELAAVEGDRAQNISLEVALVLPRILYPQEVPPPPTPFNQSLFQIAQATLPQSLNVDDYRIDWRPSNPWITLKREVSEPIYASQPHQKEKSLYLLLSRDIAAPADFWLYRGELKSSKNSAGYPPSHSQAQMLPRDSEESPDEVWVDERAKELFQELDGREIYLLGPSLSYRISVIPPGKNW